MTDRKNLEKLQSSRAVHFNFFLNLPILSITEKNNKKIKKYIKNVVKHTNTKQLKTYNVFYYQCSCLNNF